MTPWASLVLAVPLLVAHSIATQAKADFSGSWTMVAARSESPLQTPPVSSLSFKIKQTDTILDVETTRNGATSSQSYPIEKAPNPTAGTIGAGTVRAYWEGSRLVSERAGTVQGQTVSIKEIRALNADGTEMIVETLVVVQHGYAMRGAKNYGSAKDVFVRAP